MAQIKAIFFPSGEHYQRDLVESLASHEVDASLSEASWGCYLPHFVDGLIAQRPDIVHLQWPESMMSLNGQRGDSEQTVRDITGALESLTVAGIRLVWSMHNLAPHERINPQTEEAVYSVFAAMVDGTMHHSHCGKVRALATYPYSGAHAVIRHGCDQNPIGWDLTRAAARRELDIPDEKRVYLTLGGVRRAKRLETLIEAMRRRNNDRELLILTAHGQDEYTEHIRSLAQAAPNIRALIVNRAITEVELGTFAAACDAFVFTHGDVHLTSGGPHLSQTYLRPQVTMDAPYAREVLGEGGFYFDRDGDQVENLSRALDSISPELLEAKTRILAGERVEYTWEKSGQDLARFYRELL